MKAEQRTLLLILLATLFVSCRPTTLALRKDSTPIKSGRCPSRDALRFAGTEQPTAIQTPKTALGFLLGENTGLHKEFAFATPSRFFNLTLQLKRPVTGSEAKGIRLTVKGKLGESQELPIDLSDRSDAEVDRFDNGVYHTSLTFTKNTPAVTLSAEGIEEDAVLAVELEAEYYKPAQGPLALDDTPYVPPGFSGPPRGIHLIPRTEWLADKNFKPKNPPEYTTWKKIVIHHSGAFLKIGDRLECERHVRIYLQTHVKDNGWNDIAYHFLVCPTGDVFEGRAGGRNVLGAHAKDNNQETMGISFIGQYDEASKAGLNKLTPEALHAGAKLFAWVAKESAIDLDAGKDLKSQVAKLPIGALTCHTCLKENYTDCPGSLLIDKLKSGELREAAKQELKNYDTNAPIGNQPIANNGTEDASSKAPVAASSEEEC